MVKEKKIDGKKYYMCESCDMYYPTRKLAQQCEDFCNKHHACNTGIINKAVNPGGEEKRKTCKISCKGDKQKEGGCSCC